MMAFVKEGKLYLFLLGLTVFVGLFFTKLIPVFILLLLASWFFTQKDFSDFKDKRKWIWPYLFYVFIFIIGFIFSEDYSRSIKYMERMTSFLILPLAVLCVEWNKKKYELFGKIYVYGVLGVCIWSLILFFHFILTHQDFLTTVDENYLQWKLPHLSGFHPSYFGLFIVVANIILLTSAIKEKGRKKIVKFLIAIFLTLYLIYLSPRSAVISQLLIWIYISYCILNTMSSLRRKHKILLLISGGLALLLLISQSKFLVSKMSRIFSDDRFFLWPYAFEEIKKNYFLLGEGLGDGILRLEEALSRIDDSRTYYKGTDLHNQYLKNYLDFGILGLLGLVILLIRPIIILNKNKALLLFMMVFSISIFTESMLSIIKGIVFFVIMSLYFIVGGAFTESSSKKTIYNT